MLSSPPRPVPLGAAVLLDGHAERLEGRKVFLSCHVQSVEGDTLHARATCEDRDTLGVGETGGGGRTRGGGPIQPVSSPPSPPGLFIWLDPTEHRTREEDGGR